MNYGARIQSSLLILAQIFHFDMSVDKIIHHFFLKKRYIGSKDRAEIREIIYKIIRNYYLLIWILYEDTNDNNLIKKKFINLERELIISYLVYFKKMTFSDIIEVFNKKLYGPDHLSENEVLLLKKLIEKNLINIPEQASLSIHDWMLDLFKKSYPLSFREEILALSNKAPIDIRINPLKVVNRKNIFDLLLKKGNSFFNNIDIELTSISPIGIRFSNYQSLKSCSLWRNGYIEIQDEASQVISLLINAKPEERVLDLCSGSGGKSLVIASTMENKGELILTDKSTYRLNKAYERLKRAGIYNSKIININDLKEYSDKKFDKILIDAPCSGSGIWRRNPELKISLERNEFIKILNNQENLLKEYRNLIKINGLLIYITCSLWKEENQDQIIKFLNNYSNFSLVNLKLRWNSVFRTKFPYFNDFFLQFTPFQNNCDGLFISILKRDR